MRKIAISLSKGGVGKTTTSVNLAAGLALAGAKVLLVDTDTQGQVASTLGLKSEKNITSLIEEQCPINEVIVEARENLDVITGDRSIAGVKRTIDRKEYGGEFTLSEALEPVTGLYDFVLVDTSPGWDSLTINVFFYVTELLCPVSLEVLAIHGLSEFTKSVRTVQQYRKELEIAFILPTFYDGRVKKSVEILEQLRHFYDDKVCEPIRYNVRLSEAPGYEETIFEYAPDSAGADDYKLLTKRILDA